MRRSASTSGASRELFFVGLLRWNLPSPETVGCAMEDFFSIAGIVLASVCAAYAVVLGAFITTEKRYDGNHE
jgi:hypothetical protein